MTPDPGVACSRSRFLFVVLVATAALVGTACSPPEPIKVGGLVSETGAASTYGKQIKEGMDLALEQVNAGGGVVDGRPLAIVYKDDASDPAKAKVAVQELIKTERVNAVIGGVTSSVVSAVLPTFRDREMVLLSPSASSSELTSLGGGWFFRNYPSDMIEVQTMATIARDLEVKKLAILAFEETFGQSIATNFANQLSVMEGHEVVLRADFGTPLMPADAEALAKKVTESGAEGVYLAGYINEVASLLQALQAAGFKGVKITTSAITPEISRLAGAAAERLVFPQAAFDLEGGEASVKTFVDAYKKKYNRDPSVFSAYGYDAVRVFADAVKRTRLASGGEIRAALVESDFDGVTGKIRFDNRGDVQRDPHLYLVARGETMHFDKIDPSIRGILMP